MSWIGKKAADVVTSGQQLANGTVTAIKLAVGAVVSHLGYTPVNKAGDTFSGAVSISSGDLTLAAGNIVLANGKGIDFSATANANYGSMSSELLDDYEAGTFTAILSGSGFTAVSQTAYYRKIGSQVTVWINYDANLSTGAGSGGTGLQINGLPFQSSNSSCSGSIGLRSSANIDYYYIGGNSAQLAFYYKSGTGWARATGGDIVAMAYIGVTATYFI